MTTTVQVKMDHGNGEFDLSCNFLTHSTIRSHFLLHPDSVLSLSYEVDGRLKGCETRLAPEPCFLLPTNFPSMVFTAESDRIPWQLGTQAATCVPTGYEDLLQKMEKCLFYEKSESMACFTVISSHLAVSYSHGVHQKLNPDSSENQAVIICNQSGVEFRTEVVAFDTARDFVAVFSDVPLVNEPPTIALPQKSEKYFLLGFSKPDWTCEILDGIVSSVRLDNEGRILGSSVTQKGFCGGPIFNHNGELLGMNVSKESSPEFIGLNDQSKPNDLYCEINHVFPSQSVIVTASSLKLLKMVRLNFQP